ncbi:MAG: alpha/beta hydrolase [Rubrivivax sp.]|nr:alpha/beta hydrolase [Rubrivivax sp.]
MAAFLIRTFGILLMLTALAVALSRAPDRPVQTLVARWAPPPSDFVEVKGQVVHLRDEGPRHDGEGTPPPIVLIHGTSASLHTWEGWVRALKGQRRVISFDLPGFGLTGPFGGQYAPDDYRGETYAAFVLDLLDALQLKRVVLGGNSLGGEIAWRTALRAPQRLAGLVLVDALGPAFTPEQVPLGFTIAAVPVLGRISEHLLPRALVAQSVRQVYGQPGKVNDELVDRYFEITLREGNRRALGLRLQQLTLGEGAEHVATLRLPTLILWGGRDRLVPPAIGRWFHERIAGSRLVVFDELGHVPQEEDPARTVAELKAFLGP